MFRLLRSLLGMDSPAERRRSERYLDSTRVDLELGNLLYDGRLVDVSIDGARLQSHARLDVGRSMLVRVPERNGCTHLALLVTWSTRKGDRYEVGAVPDPNHRVSRMLLRNYVQRYGRGAPRVRFA
ncbi:MAG: PilZ domain-containing protein [Proteobacteria bacterium]|nr:PilZ domain-containing protein [Pseudomonadota bacterium]